jgi:hypothetical protein
MQLSASGRVGRRRAFGWQSSSTQPRTLLLRQGLGSAAKLTRLTRDLPALLRAPIGVEQATAELQRRLARRADCFLALAERAIYATPRSPYRRLLQGAGCEAGDLRALVVQEGLEGALTRLASLGVYLSFEESKGGREILRGSQRFTPTETDFDNPLLAAHLEARTGGTRSRGTLVNISLAFVRDLACNHAVSLAAHGLGAADQVLWHTAPLRDLLLQAALGKRTAAWFHPLAPLPWQVRAVSGYLAGLSSLLGHPMPAPVWADLREPRRLLDWLSGHLDAGRPIALTTLGGAAVRLARLARERGVSLAGLACLMRGEPFTEAKVELVESAGARAIDSYGFVEAGGIVGYGCPERTAVDDVHLFSDRLALVQRRRVLPVEGGTVDALLFTSLLPSSPRILLNTENGDHATLEKRACGCALGRVGLSTHLHHISSHEKLTGEGVTFARSQLVRIVEEVLPGRFGGASGDYQVVEQQDDGGVLRLRLLVNPRLGPLDDELVTQSVLAELARGSLLEANMARTWERVNTLQVVRAAPQATAAGKVLPLHLSNHPET